MKLPSVFDFPFLHTGNYYKAVPIKHLFEVSRNSEVNVSLFLENVPLIL